MPPSPSGGWETRHRHHLGALALPWRQGTSPWLRLGLRPFPAARSVVSMSTLYVLSLRTEEDLVETDGYVSGGPAAL